MSKQSETIAYARFLVEQGNTVVGINLVTELLEIIDGHDEEKAGAWGADFVPLSVRRGIRSREEWEAGRDKAFREMGLEAPGAKRESPDA